MHPNERQAFLCSGNIYVAYKSVWLHYDEIKLLIFKFILIFLPGYNITNQQLQFFQWVFLCSYNLIQEEKRAALNFINQLLFIKLSPNAVLYCTNFTHGFRSWKENLLLRIAKKEEQRRQWLYWRLLYEWQKTSIIWNI